MQHDGDRHACATLATHVDAHPIGVLPLNNHLPPWANLRSMDAIMHSPSWSTRRIIHVHLCNFITIILPIHLLVHSEDSFGFTTTILATPGPTTTLCITMHSALTQSMVDCWVIHCPVAQSNCATLRCCLLPGTKNKAVQRTELRKGSTPDDNRSMLHEHDDYHQSHNPVVR